MHRQLRNLVLAASALGVMAASPARAAPQEDQRLRKAVTVDNIFKHLRALDRIGRRNDGTRTASTPGYDASVEYVSRLLRRAGYDVVVQNFDFDYFEATGPASLERLTPTAETYVDDIDLTTATYSGDGSVTGRVVPTRSVQVPPPGTPGSTSGCTAGDFPAPPAAGSIALIQRGTCTFEEKAAFAQAAGYAAVVIFNEGQAGRTELFGGTLGRPFTIPVITTTFALGEELVGLARTDPMTATIATQTLNDERTSKNVLADSPGGRPFRTVLVGAHLDSVPEGPGINDNGSGTAANLEIALQIARLNLKPRNRLRFAFWGAEELGLLGSTSYVEGLSEAKLKTIDLNLNFDMVASPNYARLVYDGDGSEGIAGPDGSDEIEASFLKYFRIRKLATEPTAFDGRSDYGPFIEAGIPAGGLFSGAEEIKTPEQQKLFGGTAGVAFDKCYHQACDTIANVNRKSLNEFSDAMATVTWEYATRATALPKPDAKAKLAAQAVAEGFERKGDRFRR